MAKKPMSEAQKAALAKGRATRDANRQNKNPQNQNVATEVPQAVPVATPAAAPQLITLTPEQLGELVARLQAGQTIDNAPAPSLSPRGLQTNRMGQIVGVEEKYNPDPSYYPSPIEALYDEPRLRRFSMRDNYFISWDIDSKPYENKFGISIREPFFHATLYQHMFDDEGAELDDFIVVQTLHFNEDEGIALDFAAEQGIEVTEEGMRLLMDAARYERVKQWLFDIFFPPRNFELRTDAREEAIGGQVVKVVTKSNVKGFGNPTPKIKDEELS